MSDIDPGLLPFFGDDEGNSLADVLLVSGIVTTTVGTGIATLKNPKAVASLVGGTGRVVVQFGKGKLAKGLGGLALGTAMNTASATAAEQAGMTANEGRTLNAMATLGLNSYVQKGLFDTTGGRLVKGMIKPKFTAPVNELTKLSKLKTTLAGMAGGAMIGSVAVELIGTHTDLLTGFGATREQTAKHAKEFSRLQLTDDISIPNIDPVTSVIRTVDAFGDLSKANQERGHHGDKLFDAAKFTGDEVGEAVAEKTGSELLGKGADAAATLVVGSVEAGSAIGGAAMDYIIEPAGNFVGGVAREALDFLTPW